MDKTKVLISGNLPPPVGGVSVHIQRLIAMLENKKSNYETEVIIPRECLKKWGRLTVPYMYFRILSTRADIYHLHKPDHLVSIWVLFYLLGMLGRKTVFTLHNENIADQIKEGRMNSIRRWLLRVTFKRFSRIICVNERTKNVLLEQGIDEKKLGVIPAYIPQTEMVPEKLPEEIQLFARTHKPLLIGYSHRVYLYKGHDRYGGDMMLELVRRLSPDYPDIGLILIMPNKEGKANEEGIEDYYGFVRKNEIDNQVLIYRNVIDLPSLFSLSDIHIRPSNTDGDPVAVRESIYLGIPTVASDCTYKPDGVRMHKDRDNDDLEKQVREVLLNYQAEKELILNLERPNYGVDIIKIYDEILQKKYPVES